MDLGNIEQRDANCGKHGSYKQRCIPIHGSRPVWSHCPKCEDERRQREAAEKAAEDAKKAQAHAEAKIKFAGIPARFLDRTIDRFVASTKDQEKARDIALEFVANFREHRKRGTSVVFSGNPGTGKSHLAIAILQEVMKNGSGMYLNALDLVRMVRDTWRRDSPRSELEVLNTLGGLDLLVIDEVGVQYGTEGEQMILFDVLNRRYRDCMPTIMLTNMRSNEFEEYIGPRAFDRLKEGGIWLRFSWDSYRGRSNSPASSPSIQR